MYRHTAWGTIAMWGCRPPPSGCGASVFFFGVFAGVAMLQCCRGNVAMLPRQRCDENFSRKKRAHTVTQRPKKSQHTRPKPVATEKRPLEPSRDEGRRGRGIGAGRVCMAPPRAAQRPTRVHGPWKGAFGLGWGRAPGLSSIQSAVSASSSSAE